MCEIEKVDLVSRKNKQTKKKTTKMQECVNEKYLAFKRLYFL